MNSLRLVPWLAALVLGTVLAIELLAAYGARARRRHLRRWLRQRQTGS